MTAAAAILTPYSTAAAELSNKRWWKRLLPVGEIDYKGRKLSFTPDYLQGLVSAFNESAYDQVPLQLADADNRHTNAVERFGGQIAAMELRGDGLYVGVDPTERGEAVLAENPKLGVSARIVEGYSRSDGKFFPKAIQHVLATLDPRIPGLGGWQAIEASNVADVTYDLSSGSYTGEDSEMPELNDEQKARLAALLDLDPAKLAALVAQLPGELTPETVGQLNGDQPADELTDEELDELVEQALALDAAGLLEDGELEDQREPVAAGLAVEDQMAIELAQATSDENARQLKIISDQLDAERWQGERRKLVAGGTPPFIADLAQPLLEGAGHVVDLSGGKTVDAGQIVRKILTEYAKITEQLGIGVELGTPMDGGDDGETAAAARNAVVDRAAAQMFGIRR
jgi:hypothetical protein